MRHFAALVLLAASCSKEPEKAPATRSHSALYERFDPDELSRKYSSSFERVGSGGARSGIKITPPGDMFKSFTLRGTIPEERRKQLLADLKADLAERVKAGGVAFAGEPGEMKAGRPILRVFQTFDPAKSGTLQGFFFEYRHGAATGAVEVLAAVIPEEGREEWTLVCAVHEPGP